MLFNQVNTEDIAFVIPFKTDNGRREEIFYWNCTRLQKLFPGSQICVGENNDELFNLSAARNDGLRKISEDKSIVFSLDADTVWNPELLIDAVSELQYKDTAWVIPYMVYLNIDMEDGLALTKDSPDRILEYNDFNYCGELVVPPNDPYPPVSGVVAIKMEAMQRVGGFDERCRGWGHEDRIFALVAEKILGEPPKRLNHMVYHIWHPIGQTVEQPHYHDNWNLFRDYERNFAKTYRRFI